MYLHVQAPTGSVVDRHHVDADPDPKLTHAVKSEFFLL
jgi:hypothetical protein